MLGPYGLFALLVPLKVPTGSEAPAFSLSAVEEVLEVFMFLSTNKFPFITDIAMSPVATTPLKLSTVPMDMPLP